MRRVRPAWRGGGGQPVNHSPGGLDRPKPLLRPPQVGNIAGVTGDALVMGGAAPILFWFIVTCCPWAWFLCRSGALARACPSAATPAGAGGGGRRARGVRVQLPPPPPASRSLLGEGGRPLGSGRAESRRSCSLQAGGGAGGGGGAPLLSAPLPRRVSPCHPLSPAGALGVYSCCGGCRAAVGARRGPVGCQWVSAAGGGGSDLLALVRAPAFPRPASELGGSG